MDFSATNLFSKGCLEEPVGNVDLREEGEEASKVCLIFIRQVTAVSI